MTERAAHEDSVTGLTCAMCGGPFPPGEATVYLRMNNVLMHRACCHAYPSCQCYGKRIKASAASTTG